MLKDLIYKEYMKAALLPIFIIEATLLIIYFSTTGYIENKTKNTLLTEAKQNIKEISKREAKNINQQINSMTDLGIILQKENQRYFTHPEDFRFKKGVDFGYAENGVFYKLNNNGGSSLFYSKLTSIGNAQRKKALGTEALDPILKAVYEANSYNVGVYFNSFDSMCRYYPFLPQVYNVFEADMNIPQFNFYYEADGIHDPLRSVVWTNAYLDPAGKGWMASCIAPIYNKDFLEGVTGIDITIDKIVKNILNLKLPWNSGAFLVDKNGVILAMPENTESILKLKELREQAYKTHVKKDTLKPQEFNLLNNKDHEIANQIKGIFKSGSVIKDFQSGGKKYFITQDIIEKTGWHLMILVDKDSVYEPIHKLDAITKRIGTFALLFMICFYILFFYYLMHKSKRIADKIADPVIDVAVLTREMIDSHGIKKDKYQNKTDIEEIEMLMDNFNKMTEELDIFYTSLENKVLERTEELEKKNNELKIAYKELKEIQQQIVQQEKMASIGQLVAGVAHEINNPMGFIISNLGTLKKYSERLEEYTDIVEKLIIKIKNYSSADEDCFKVISEADEAKKRLKVDYMREDIGDLIDETLEGAERIRKIVLDLKTFARTNANVEPGNINEGIESVLNIIWNEIKYKITLKKELGDIPLTMCNIGQLSQVFMNILINAAHAVEQKGEIDIKTWTDNKIIYIKISDNGCGIPEDTIGRIFEPFFTTKEVGKGTGLGLSVSYEIVKKHNGDIRVISEPGKGTEFLISIPVVEK